MSDTETVKQMLGLVDEYDLEGREFVHRFSLDQLSEDFNGIGPEWFNPNLREAIDNLHADLLPVAFVHDVRWSHSSGSRYYFERSNDEFKRNGYKVAKANYSWYDPRRYFRMNQARIFGNLCQAFGWSAYETAYVKSQEGTKQ